ncbi:MAG: hypothetical protein E5W03_16465, partial [Mesorhizobium sp.]
MVAEKRNARDALERDTGQDKSPLLTADVGDSRARIARASDGFAYSHTGRFFDFLFFIGPGLSNFGLPGFFTQDFT